MPFVSFSRASTSIFLENLLTASTFEIRVDVDLRFFTSTFEIRVDVYEHRLAFSRRRLKSASTFMNVDLRFHVDV